MDHSQHRHDKRPREQACVVSLCLSRGDTEATVAALERSGITLENVSLVGQDFQERGQVEGYYSPADGTLLTHPKGGGWRSGLFGKLFGFGYFLVPEVGPLFVLGPLAGIVATGATHDKTDVLLSSLVSLGLSHDEAVRFQSRIRAGEFLVVAQGSGEEMTKARRELDSNAPTIQVSLHIPGPSAAISGDSPQVAAGEAGS